MRVAAWSARHRWPVVLLWFVLTIGLFVTSLTMGGTLTADAVDDDSEEQSTYEAARAYDLFGASGTQETTHQTLLVIGDPERTLDDAAFAADIDDILARMAAHTTDIDGAPARTFEEIVDPRLAPPEAGLVSPDRSTVRIAAAVPGDGAALDARHQSMRGFLDETRVAHPGLRIHSLDGTLANDDIQELKDLGVSEVFTPGAPVQGIIDYIKQAVPA